MAPTRTPTESRFEPPGPGFWELDPVHFPRPATRYWIEIHPAAFRRGTSEFARSYGMLIDALEMAYVNGFAYRIVRPVAEDEVPRRFQRAEEVFQRKYWREQLRDWNETFKPTSIKAHRALQSVDPDGLSDDALAAHLTRCRDHHAEMLYQHMRFTAAAIVPTGDFLAHVGDWTGLPPAELLGLMRGTSPVSAGASAQLGQLITAIRQDPRAQQLLESEDDPGRVLEALRSLDRRHRRGRVRRISTSSGTGSSTASISRTPSRSSCRTRCAAPFAPPLRRPAPTRRTSKAGSPTCAARCPRSIGPSSTSCSRRRG